MENSCPQSSKAWSPRAECAPDPAGLAAADPADPQSWNRYAYVVNQPLTLTDPDGRHLRQPGEWDDWGCTLDGQAMDCADVGKGGLGGNADAPCTDNACSGFAGTGPLAGKFVQFHAWADGSSGYLPLNAPPGFSIEDMIEAVKIATETNRTPIDPSALTGAALKTYNDLEAVVGAQAITLWAQGDGAISFTLTQDALHMLLQGLNLVEHGIEDAFSVDQFHTGYTNAARDTNPYNSLHLIWIDPSVTNFLGGNGTVFATAHTDPANPFGGFVPLLKHTRCAFLGDCKP